MFALWQLSCRSQQQVMPTVSKVMLGCLQVVGLKYAGGRFSAAELPTVKLLRKIPFPVKENIKIRFPSFSDIIVDWV